MTGEIVATTAVSEGHDKVEEKINEKMMRKGKEGLRVVWKAYERLLEGSAKGIEIIEGR